jgi:SAM-dependent methyltransferase
MLRGQFRVEDGISVPVGAAAADAYTAQWESEAEDDHVRAAIAADGEATLEALTRKTTRIWERLPRGARYGTILDLGCGYGRLALHLGATRGVSCDRYVAVDVSRGMLRHLLRYRERFGVFPGAEVLAVQASIDELPLEDGSVDLAVSSAVFLHMGTGYLRRALAEVARVLRPGGAYVFESSFPNSRCPANLPFVLRGRLGGTTPNRVKFRSEREVRELVRASGLGPFAVEPTGYALLPKRLGPLEVPLARRVNAALGTPPRLRGLLAVSFSVASL